MTEAVSVSLVSSLRQNVGHISIWTASSESRLPTLVTV